MDRPWTCAEPLHLHKSDVGRAGNEQRHGRGLGGRACAAQKQEEPSGRLPRYCRRRLPAGGPAREAPPGCCHVRTPRRHRPRLCPAPARRPSDTRAGRGGAVKVPRSPRRPAPPRHPRRALLTSPSSPPPPPPLPVGRPEVTPPRRRALRAPRDRRRTGYGEVGGARGRPGNAGLGRFSPSV